LKLVPGALPPPLRLVLSVKVVNAILAYSPRPLSVEKPAVPGARAPVFVTEVKVGFPRLEFGVALSWSAKGA
jgi:hypothetical protein